MSRSKETNRNWKQVKEEHETQKGSYSSWEEEEEEEMEAEKEEEELKKKK